jgi:protein O-GlcNAc transferase
MSMRDFVNEGLRRVQTLDVAAALTLFEKAAEIEPDSHIPPFMLGNAFSHMGDLDMAATHYRRARGLKSSEAVIRFNFGLNELSRGYTENAIAELREACRLNPQHTAAQSTYLVALLNSDRHGADDIAAAARDWGNRFAAQHPETGKLHQARGAGPPRRLRVGFVSGDFRTHSVARFFEPIASGHDRDAFDYFFYHNFPDHDEVTERLRGHAHQWRDVWRLDDDALVERIRSDNVDILVDLAGHTAFNRLTVFARRAAPVQVTYLGFPASTGLPTMDYRITDASTDPIPGAGAWHSERLLQLQRPQWCYRPFAARPAADGLPARSSGFVTFGSFNSTSKISATTIECWGGILGALPQSRLRLTRIRSPQRAAEIVSILGQSGIEPARIDCLPYKIEVPVESPFAGVDIALDSHPYNGVTTTCESLFSGVPVISLHGAHGASRSGLSILGAMDLRDLVASTPAQYTQIAVGLARDLPRLERLRSSLQAMFERSALRDESGFARAFEAQLRAAWLSRSGIQLT